MKKIKRPFHYIGYLNLIEHIYFCFSAYEINNTLKKDNEILITNPAL